MTATSPGAKFRAALAAETPLQVPGTICAYHAILAEKTGYKAIYLSGGGVAAGSLGVPDLGITTLDDVLTDVLRITNASTLPLLVDVDTGFVDAVRVPVLANITEFGQTPLFTLLELEDAGVALALYPLSAFRAMNSAALNVYRTLRRDGTQKAALDTMQTRAELYEFLGYHAYEAKLDALFAKTK